MKVALVLSASADLDRIRTVVTRLREKYPAAVIVTDNTARHGRFLDALGIDAEQRPDYLDAADRILVFGRLVDPVLRYRNEGKPTVVYHADGSFDSYDEVAFEAALLATFDAEIVTTDEEWKAQGGAPRRCKRPEWSQFDDRRNTSRVFPPPPGAGAEYIASREEDPSPEQTTPAPAPAPSLFDTDGLTTTLRHSDRG